MFKKPTRFLAFKQLISRGYFHSPFILFSMQETQLHVLNRAFEYKNCYKSYISVSYSLQMKNMPENNISSTEAESLLGLLKQRFEKNMQRHKGLDWQSLEQKLRKNRKHLSTLKAMEDTGGEPDVIGYDKQNDSWLYCDCAAETPAGRRSLCYDKAALDSRKENKPSGSAIAMAEAMGITILDEATYRYLQKLGSFDLKTSSWVLTPEPIRKLGGALFCDRRYNTVFLYHNGASSYYAARGFRGMLEV